MLRLALAPRDPARLQVLALGAHADDIEIGCGGTILRLCAEFPTISVRWVVLSAKGERVGEARTSAGAFLASTADAGTSVEAFRDGFFPSEITRLKEYLESVRASFTPDLVLTHHRGDLHQDHRVVADLTWQTFRDQLILEYEIPKFDGDLGAPNLHVALDPGTADRKVALLMEHYPSQRSRHWFTEDTFRALLRLRGVEAGQGTRYAEGFYCSKLVL